MSDPHAQFVHQTNISHFEKILKTETDLGQIQRIQRLLAKEKLQLSQFLNALASHRDLASMAGDARREAAIRPR